MGSPSDGLSGAIPPVATPAAPAGARAAPVPRARSFWTDAAARFRRNALALVGLGIAGLLVFAALFAPFITPEPYDVAKFGQAWQFPSPAHWLGTDGIGRDFYTRIVYGSRVSLFVGLSAQAIALLIGLPLGLIAGLRGGRADFLIMRVVDALWSFPRMLFALLILSAIGSGLQNVLLAISLTSWIPICRLTRAQLLTERERDYVLAARALGASQRRIALVHLVPNIVPPLIVALTLGIPEAIFAEAGLSFLGLGVNPPLPSWGQMVGESVSYINFYWYLALFPALAIALAMLGFTLVGDGLRDALDPRMTR
ncbi:MAG TPA: ABC transporter permease [Thermomicrobiales bacterium]|nr:ABC transporter permease [Thermomicrobiales bacterium]